MLEENVLDSSEFEPKSFAKCDLSNADLFENVAGRTLEKVTLTLKFNITKMKKNPDIKFMILNGKENREGQKH